MILIYAAASFTSEKNTEDQNSVFYVFPSERILTLLVDMKATISTKSLFSNLFWFNSSNYHSDSGFF